MFTGDGAMLTLLRLPVNRSPGLMNGLRWRLRWRARTDFHVPTHMDLERAILDPMTTGHARAIERVWLIELLRKVQKSGFEADEVEAMRPMQLRGLIAPFRPLDSSR